MKSPDIELAMENLTCKIQESRQESTTSHISWVINRCLNYQLSLETNNKGVNKENCSKPDHHLTSCSWIKPPELEKTYQQAEKRLDSKPTPSSSSNDATSWKASDISKLRGCIWLHFCCVDHWARGTKVKATTVATLPTPQRFFLPTLNTTQSTSTTDRKVAHSVKRDKICPKVHLRGRSINGKRNKIRGRYPEEEINM